MSKVKEELIKNELGRRGISMDFENITKVLSLPIPVCIAYTAVLNNMVSVISNASVLKQYEELKTLGEELEISFEKVKSRLEKAQKDGKGNQMCIDVFRPVYVA
jgi:hypothetical protein